MIEHMESTASPQPGWTDAFRCLPRLALLSFLLTFAAARIVVFLIMSRTLPDLFLHIGGTHIHHLNYGIFLLAFVGAAMLFVRPSPRWLKPMTILYGVGLGLTFDEFGMWVHLSGGYWQRASFDAVCVVAAILGLIAFAPSPRSWRARHWLAAVAVLAVTAAFFTLLAGTLRNVEHRLAPKLEQLEREGPT